MKKFEIVQEVRLPNEKKIIGHIKQSLGNSRGPYPDLNGYYYTPKGSKSYGELFESIAEVNRSLGL
jgi:hypothetical protein